MRIIDADELTKEYPKYMTFTELMGVRAEFEKAIDSAPTVKTKQIKYFDEDEKVWKIGEVIVDE